MEYITTELIKVLAEGNNLREFFRQHLETTIIQLYKKGITTKEIADLIHNMYGHHYSAQIISNITKLVGKMSKLSMRDKLNLDM